MKLENQVASLELSKKLKEWTNNNLTLIYPQKIYHC
jgi:hypothetical protein